MSSATHITKQDQTAPQPLEPRASQGMPEGSPQERTLHTQEMEGSCCSPPSPTESGPWCYTHLSEKRVWPSFCHPVWNSGEVWPGQKSCTACPTDAWTREGSEPAKLILER